MYGVHTPGAAPVTAESEGFQDSVVCRGLGQRPARCSEQASLTSAVEERRGKQPERLILLSYDMRSKPRFENFGRKFSFGKSPWTPAVQYAPMHASSDVYLCFTLASKCVRDWEHFPLKHHRSMPMTLWYHRNIYFHKTHQ